MLLSLSVSAQHAKEDAVRTTHFPVMKEIVNTRIPGAPLLSKPQHINGTLQDIRTEEHGLAYPVLYDWNHDGKRDLLVGDFVTGKTGSFIKVYLNIGTDTKPRFTGKYFWATDEKGDTITNYQWCCIGIHPRIVDIDGDGYPDILSGQYNPGKISWWRGSKEGFLPRQYIPQDGDPEGKYDSSDWNNPHSEQYWVYSSADFGDFNGDGLLDLFVGGVSGLRVALNEGTKGSPRFGIRQHLLFTDGSEVMLNGDKLAYESSTKHIKTYIKPIDWDGDGVLDLLVTDEYEYPGDNPIEFFKGVKTNKGLRFAKPVPLFTAKDGSKVFPGCQPMISVADVNGDGVNDILFGLSIPTLNGFNVTDTIAWNWIRKLGIEMPGKDAGEVCASMGFDKLKASIISNPPMRGYYLGNLTDYKYLTLRHRGYVFVMYGSKNPVPAAKAVTVEAKDPAPLPTQPFEGSKADSPVSYRLDMPKVIDSPGNYHIGVTLSFKKGWHGYTDSKANAALGMIPTTVEIILPDWIGKEHGISLPISAYTGSTIYTGEISFKQFFLYWERTKNRHTEIPVKIKINYQVCNDQMCFPPEEHVIEKVIPIKVIEGK
jgi:hypothetical protein